jgi:glycosyltransferase involved in cell wall biosynthesis
MTPVPTSMQRTTHGRVGVVAIGRNEGERFARCLASVVGGEPLVSPVIYVDSGSTDGSIELAIRNGVHVVHLDMSKPFTASRARNAGLAALRQRAPEVPYVMFVDGDCEIAPTWLAAGCTALDGDAKLGIVSGRLQEFFPEASIYNRLADLEWNKPVGDKGHCGGNAMMRVAVIEELHGFDEALLAGEEPDLCERVRAKGFVVRRVADAMAKHDLAMMRFHQWWTRQRKGGYGSFDVTLFGPRVSRHIFRKAVVSSVVWGLLFFVGVALLAVLAWWWRGPVWGGLAVLGGVGVWLLQSLRIANGAQKRGLATRDALAFGLLMMTSKIAYVRGGATNIVDRLFRRGPATINYKADQGSVAQPGAREGASHAV